MHRVEIYADGACSGNPGPSGIGVVLKSGKHYKEISKAIGYATNNRAEIQAAIEGTSLKGLIIKALTEYLKRAKKKGG